MNKKIVIIGGGLGGVSAAVSLALEGHKVHLYEKNDHIGGKLNKKEQDGFSFDLGPSILTMPHLFEFLFEKAGKDMSDYVKLEAISPHWRCFFEDEQIIDLYPEPGKMVAKNPVLTKEDEEDLQQFFEYSEGIYETVNKSYFKKGIDDLKGILKEHGFYEAWKGFDFFHTMHQGVEKRISNPYLIQIFDYFVKYVGSSAYDAPAVLNLMSYIQFQFGLWYVHGGMYNLALALEKLMLEEGVRVHKNTEVIGLNEESGRIISATLDDGSTIEADIFVSNMEVIPAYDTLFSKQPEFLDDYRKKFEPACSGFVLHLGVDRKYDSLKHHNFFFSKDSAKNFQQVFHEKKLPSDPTIYLVASSRTDSSQSPEDCENIKILPHIPHLTNGDFSREDYLEFKDLVLDKLERMGLTDLRKHIVTEELWLPSDIQAKYYSNKGAIYGVLSDRNKNRGFKAPKKSEKYDNLFFVGGSVNPGGGMPMVTLSGQQVGNIIQSY